MEKGDAFSSYLIINIFKALIRSIQRRLSVLENAGKVGALPCEKRNFNGVNFFLKKTNWWHGPKSAIIKSYHASNGGETP